MISRTSDTISSILLWVCALAAACVGDPSELSAQCLVDEDCGSCGYCRDGACEYDEGGASDRCVSEADDPCDGIDNDDNGIVDDPETCWAPVFRYGGEGLSTCWASSPLGPPAQCAGNALLSDAPAFWLASRPIDDTVAVRLCSKDGDHVLARATGLAEDGLTEIAPVEAWQAAGYACEVLLGYAFAGMERRERYPDGQACALTRRLDGIRHAYVLGAGAGGRCDPGFGDLMVVAETCTGAPTGCALVMCPPTPEARFVAQRHPDVLVLPPFTMVQQAWTLENIGPIDWPASWAFVRLEGTLSTTSLVPFQRAVPVGDRVTLEIEFGTPETGLELIEHWAIRTDDRRLFGHVVIRFSVATPFGGRLVDRRPEAYSEHRPDSDLTLSLVLENTAAATWPEGSRLIRQSGQLASVGELVLDRDIPFGDRWSVDLMARAPPNFGDWGETWRFETPDGTPIAIDGGYLRWSIRVLGDHRVRVLAETYPSGTVLRPGTPFVKLYMLENRGVWSWAPGWSFRASAISDLSERAATHLVDPVAPGERMWLAIPMRVPLSPTDRSWVDAWHLYDDRGVVVPVGRPTPTGETFSNLQSEWLQTRIISGEPCRR